MTFEPFSRRAFIAAMAAGALGSSRAFGLGDKSKFVISVAQHGKWEGRLSGLRRLTWEVQRRTSVEVLPFVPPIPFNSRALFEQPFLYWGGEGEVPPLKADDIENLRRYLTFGGFLLVDANDGSSGLGFDASVRRELARVLPQAPLAPLPMDHVVFKSFFLLDAAPGRLLNKPYLEAARVGKRAAVIYSQNDLAGAWSRDEGGQYEFDVSPGGESQRELAFRVGINICMYALCLDYKDDAVHLPLIMNKRR